MKSELVYIYGKHAVAEALTFRPDVVKEVFIDTTLNDDRLLARIGQARVAVKPFPKRLPGGLRPDAVHQGVIAGIDVGRLMVEYKTFAASLTAEPHSSVLILGELQDPHNVGAVIRSAAAFGVSGVLIPPHNQSPVTGTVVKVSVGMAFRVPLVEIRNVNATIEDLKKRGYWVYGLAGEGAVSLYGEAFSKPTAFILGNEGTGLRQKTREACDTLISIPMHPRCESLNAAASAAVVMAEWSRQHPEALSPAAAGV